MPEEKTKKEKIHMALRRGYGWKISTVALFALLIISMFSGGFRDLFASGPQGTAEETIKYINTNLLNGQSTATLKGVTEENGLYKMNLDVGGSEFDSYVTKDGKILFPQAIDMTETTEQAQASQTQTPEAQNVPKSDKPTVQAFVFSYCPYGLQFEKALLPVYNLLKNKAGIELVAIGAMHGEYEKQESLRQVCIENKYNKDKLWAYLEKFMADTKIGACGSDMTCSKPLAEQIMTQLGIDKGVINDCMVKDAESLYQVQNNEASGLGISGSPTFVINGVETQVARNPEAIKKVICDSFNTPPAECSQTLSTASASAGFGAGTSGSSSGGGCG